MLVALCGLSPDAVASLGHNAKLLLGDFITSVSSLLIRGKVCVRLDGVNAVQPHQTNYTQRYALCKTTRTTLSTLSQERFSPWRTM